MKLLPALVVLFIPLVGHSQHYPAVGTKFVYDSYDYNDLSSEIYTETIISVDEPNFAVAKCEEEFCAIHSYKDLDRYDKLIQLEYPLAALQDYLDLLISDDTPGVNISDERGASAFPLADGKRLSWEEEFRENDYSSDIHLSMKINCCRKSPNNLFSASSSSEIWQIEILSASTTNYGDGQPASKQLGGVRLSYDPKIKWFIAIEELHWPLDEGSPWGSMKLLRSVNPPEVMDWSDIASPATKR